MAGITRTSKESIFSDLNNLEVITTTFIKYSILLIVASSHSAACLVFIRRQLRNP